LFFLSPLWAPASFATSDKLPFAPGEKLQFELRWENVPAGEATMEVLSVKTINGTQVYHFVLTAKSNNFIDFFYKVRDRVEAYADLGMNHSIQYYQDQREGRYKKKVAVAFDWEKNQAHYSRKGKGKKPPLDLIPGSFDPLSAFYFTRLADFKVDATIERPVTDGKKNVMGRAKVVARETIELKSGTYDTFLIEPDIKDIGGVFKKSKNAKIQVWVTADENRIPVRIKSKVVVGHFIGDLISAEGI
jgi:Protein of unknown function (DUF3108)